jgi:nifR3 family TIM-barrel protein
MNAPNAPTATPPTSHLAATTFELPGYQVGPVKVHPGLVLAPMSGVTDSPFRRLVKHCSGRHVGLVVSEFISIDMLTKGQMRQAIRMAFHAEERPVSLQLYGADPVLMGEAAQMVEDTGADMVDINCGCPEPKICRRGGGAGLLRDLPRLAKILDEVTRRVSIPVTIKIRNGWDHGSVNHLESLRVAEDGGAKAIALHGRTRMQLYTGEADWGAVAELKRHAKIPVLGSGDVVTAEDARKRFVETGCDGVLIGRGAVTNPWIFRQIGEVCAGLAPYEPTWRDVIEALRLYREWLDAQYPPVVAPGRMRMMLSRFLKGFPTDPGLRVRCLKMQSPVAMLDHLEEVARATGVLDEARVAPNDEVAVAA